MCVTACAFHKCLTIGGVKQREQLGGGMSDVLVRLPAVPSLASWCEGD